ncbi:MAG: hypothetical protein Q8P31_12010 [Bacillota bacterium]|nr:hypothetical protein [Bacillota bacterium]
MAVPDEVARELLADHELGTLELVVYFVTYVASPISLSALAAEARTTRSAAAMACSRLAQRGWLSLTRCGKGLRPTVLVPQRCQELMANALETGYSLVANKGEYLMKRFLDLRVDSDEYIDNARPGFLINPKTGELLEYDRYYLLHGVAFEFNGPQHYELTGRYPDERTLRETQTRDLIKGGISLNAKVAMVTVTVDQLHPDILETLLPAQLPRRTVDVGGCYYRTLASLCTGYGAKARAAGRQ